MKRSMLKLGFAMMLAFALIDSNVTSAEVYFGGTGDSITLEDLQMSCKLSKGGTGKEGEEKYKQYVVKNPVIECVDTFITWHPVPSDRVIHLQNQRTVSASLSDKAFFVPVVYATVEAGGKQGGCSKFKQFTETYVYRHSTSCDEVMGLKGNLVDFCTTKLNEKKGGDAKMVERIETGNVIDTCSAGTEGKGGGKGGL